MKRPSRTRRRRRPPCPPSPRGRPSSSSSSRASRSSPSPLKSEQKFTQPPARYTEASLIKALEENGIGRPSTYAPIITTIIDRGYVERDQKKLKPTPLGRTVDSLMLEQFPRIVDVDFSAQMEKNLDKIESGRADWRQTIDGFYKDFDASLQAAEKNMEGKKVKVPDEPSSEVCPLCGKPMVVKVGKYGKFLACSGFPECRGTKRLVKDTGGICPKCGQGRLQGPHLLRLRALPRLRLYDLGRAGAHQVRKVRRHPLPPRFQALLRQRGLRL